MRKHWLALCKGSDGRYFISNHFYPDSETARRELGPHFVRLADDFAAVMLPDPPPEKEWSKPRPPAVQSPSRRRY